MLRGALSQQRVCDGPRIFTFLELLQTALDVMDLGWIALVCWIVQLGYQLEEWSVGSEAM